MNPREIIKFAKIWKEICLETDLVKKIKTTRIWDLMKEIIRTREEIPMRETTRINDQIPMRETTKTNGKIRLGELIRTKDQTLMKIRTKAQGIKDPMSATTKTNDQIPMKGTTKANGTKIKEVDQMKETIKDSGTKTKEVDQMRETIKDSGTKTNVETIVDFFLTTVASETTTTKTMNAQTINKEIILETEQNLNEDVVDTLIDKIRNYSRFQSYIDQKSLCYM